MKARVFNHNDALEAQLENGSVYSSKPGENLDQFSERVIQQVEADFMDTVEFTVVDSKKLKRLGTDKLTSQLETATGLEATMIGEILEARANLKGGTAKKKAAPKKAAKAKPAAKKEAKPKKEPKPKMSLEGAQKEAAKAKTNVGKFVIFDEHGTDEELKGQIRGVVIDKRVPMVLYRIYLDDGTLRHKRPNNMTIEFDDERTQAWLTEQEEAKARKEAEKAAAKEAKAKARQEAKEAKAAERAAAKEAKAKEKAEAKAKKDAERAAAKEAKAKAAAEKKAAKEAEKAAKAKAKEEAAAKKKAAETNAKIAAAIADGEDA